MLDWYVSSLSSYRLGDLGETQSCILNSLTLTKCHTMAIISPVCLKYEYMLLQLFVQNIKVLTLKLCFAVKMANTCTNLFDLCSQRNKLQRVLDQNSVQSTLAQTWEWVPPYIFLTSPLVLSLDPAVSSVPGSQQWRGIVTNISHSQCQPPVVPH